MSTIVFYSLSTDCQYLTLNPLYVFCQYAHCCLLQFVHGLSVPHTIPPVCSVSICPLLSSTFCPLSVNASHCTTCLFCVTMPTAVFYSLSTVCQYLSLYHLFVMCHYVHCCLLQSVYCLSIPLTVPPVCSMLLCPLLSSTVCKLSVNTSHCTTCLFCVSMSTAVFYSLFTDCQSLTLHHLCVVCHYVHCCLLQSVYCLSIPLTVPPVCSVSLCPLLSSTVCPLSVSTSHCTICVFCVTMSTAFFYSLSTVCKYLTLYHLCVLCHYVHCCLLQSVLCLSGPHTEPPVCSETL